VPGRSPGLVDATLDKVFAAVINELGAWGVMTLLGNRCQHCKVVLQSWRQ